jgi:hypothetical protein
LWIFTLAEAELFGDRYTVDNLTREYIVGSCPVSIP